MAGKGRAMRLGHCERIDAVPSELLPQASKQAHCKHPDTRMSMCTFWSLDRHVVRPTKDIA
jgi:hypothetical protein